MLSQCEWCGRPIGRCACELGGSGVRLLDTANPVRLAVRASLLDSTSVASFCLGLYLGAAGMAIAVAAMLATMEVPQ